MKKPTGKIPCYGKEHGKHEACGTCRYAKYCKDARDISLMAHTPFEKIEYAEEYVRDINPRRAKRRTLAILGFVETMDAIRSRQPKIYTILIEKLRQPEKSLSELGASVGIDKQLAHYHFQKLMKSNPEFKEAILFDTRYRPKRGKFRPDKKNLLLDKGSARYLKSGVVNL